jgi:hypothetical protein
MRYMNDYDLTRALHTYNPYTTPNRAYLAATVANLAAWANSHSDGWAYWPKPVQAARRAIELIDSTTNAENDRRRRIDATDAETAAALRPIKAFLTREKIPHTEVLPPR